MVTLLDPKWSLLRYHIDANDKLGLSLINPAHFTGLPRTILQIAHEQPELSMPVMQQAMRAALDGESFEYAIGELMRHEIAASDVDHYRRALATSYNNWRIKDAVDWASEQISQGQNRMRVLEELYSRLSNVHDVRGITSFEDVFKQIAGMNVPTIPTGMEAFARAGLTEWQTGNLALLAGDTGTFKTTTAVNLCRAALMADPGLHVFYFMKEQPMHEVWYKLFAADTPFTYSEIQSRFNSRNPDMVESVRSTLTPETTAIFERFHVVSQDTFSTPQDVASMLRGFSVKYPKIIWVLDYATRLDFGGRPEHFNSYYAAGLETMKNATLATQSFGIIITQLKEGWNIDFKTGKQMKIMPTRNHIIWSSESKNLAAYIMMLYNPGTYFDIPKKYLYLTFQKVRHIETVKRVNCLVNGEKQIIEAADGIDNGQMDAILNQLKKESNRGS